MKLMILSNYYVNYNEIFLDSFEMATENPFLGPKSWEATPKSQGFRIVAYFAIGDSMMKANVPDLKFENLEIKIEIN